MQRWIMPLNSGLIILIIIVLAKISADIVSYRLATMIPAVAGKRAAATSPVTAPATDDLMSYGPIVERGLFGKATQGKLTAITQATEGKGAATAPSDLVLLGTAIGSFRETFALVVKSSTKEERVFRLGDQVFDSGQLISVQKESAEILSGGRKVKILTPSAAAAEGKPAQAAAGAPQGNLASQVGAGNYVIDQRALNAALDNIGQAMTDARLLPSIKDGKVEGFKVSEVRPTGIFGTIGIKNGDVLQRINDFPIDSPEKAIQSFASLKGQSRIKLDLVRDGQPTTFNYDIR